MSVCCLPAVSLTWDLDDNFEFILRWARRRPRKRPFYLYLAGRGDPTFYGSFHARPSLSCLPATSWPRTCAGGRTEYICLFPALKLVQHAGQIAKGSRPDNSAYTFAIEFCQTNKHHVILPGHRFTPPPPQNNAVIIIALRLLTLKPLASTRQIRRRSRRSLLQDYNVA